jgi:hypothetical protein
MNERRIVVARDSGISIRSFQDIREAMAVCIESDGLILTEDDVATEFFDLRSGLAGELFQVFVNYRIPLAIVLHKPEGHGTRFAELAYEHGSHNLIRFLPSEDEARVWLAY